MDRQYVVDHNIVDRYVRDELTPEEATAFEQFYLDDPETLEELEISALFAEHPAARKAPAAKERVSIWPIAAAVVATAVVAIVGFSLVSLESDRAQANFRVIDVVATRAGSDDTTTVRLRSDELLIGLRIEVPDASGRVALRIARQGSVVISVDGLEVDALGEIQVAIPTAQLRAGPYELLVFGEAGDRLLLERGLEIL